MKGKTKEDFKKWADIKFEEDKKILNKTFEKYHVMKCYARDYISQRLTTDHKVVNNLMR